VRVADVEREKYEAMWAVEDYANFSPGEKWLPVFLELVGDKRGTLLDAGCGTGVAGAALAREGFDVTLADLTGDQIRGEAEDLRFRPGPLWKPFVRRQFDVGYCCDVLEHVPPEFTLLTIQNLLRACDRLFLSIATEPDQFGAAIGQPLHLTVQPFAWWRDRLREIATLHDARDCGNTAIFWASHACH
jgi:2-polyprenyl-3-methyl-5-hydroxy-6-metoxy-1,4-benzoquinol methylase